MNSVSKSIDWVHRQKQVVRVALVAGIGTVASFVTYEFVFYFNQIEPRATTSWAISFFIGVFRQHHLHWLLSFHAAKSHYAESLGRDWIASLFVLAFSVALNYALTQKLAMYHRLAWAICLICAAGIEYALLKFFVFRKSRTSKCGR